MGRQRTGRTARKRRQPPAARMARPKGARRSVNKVASEGVPAGKVADDPAPYGLETGGAGKKRQIEQYAHTDKQRTNNPPVGLVTPESDRDGPKKEWQYDPHLDPQLVWSGKAERTSFAVPTISLHVHERIDPKTIIQAVKRRNGGAQPSLFDRLEEPQPLREALDFYRHPHGWSNRLIAGDSLLVMNSLLEKEGLGGKVQMVYLDPPYGIKYGSNFQPFVNKRDVKDGKDEDLTQEPEMIRAFRDTWELGIHSYLSYLRDRLLVARELLTESGSCFVQISDDNLHHVKEGMDEVFGSQNYCGLIAFNKTTGATAVHLPTVTDFVLWYCRNLERVKFHSLFVPRGSSEAIGNRYTFVEMPDASRRNASMMEQEHPDLLPQGSKLFSLIDLTSQRQGRMKGPGAACWFTVNYQDKAFTPSSDRAWTTNEDGMNRLVLSRRVHPMGTLLRYVRYNDDFPATPLSNLWADVGGIQSRSDPKVYAVQTSTKVVARCLLMTTDPGDLVFDPTCGSGTTAFVAEQWGRRWITCDTSRVAITLAKQRLMTAVYDYYELQHPQEGIGSGFLYKTVPHVTLKSIANNPEIKPGMSREAIETAIQRHAETETLYDQPLVDNKKVRVTGPFTVEAVPAPTVQPVVAHASSVPEVPQPSRLAEEAGKDACATVPHASSVHASGLRTGFHWRGYLPHFKEEGAVYFVTFRLAGTLPRDVLERFKAERQESERRAKSTGGSEVGKDQQDRLRKLYAAKIDGYLDAGRGECWLKNPQVAELVSRALLHFNGQRYQLHAWVVMPNHVHAVLTPLKQNTLTEILHSWKSFTANEANKILDRKGQDFWQTESYDHIVRDEGEFQRCCGYVEANPVKAGLCEDPGQWVHGSACGVAHASSVQQVPQPSRLPEEAGRDACATITADITVARSGATLRHTEWRDELLRCGVRAKGGQKLAFSRVEPLAGFRWLHADAEASAGAAGRVVISFGPEHAPLESKQVELAWEEARQVNPKPAMILFCAFQFDPEAAKDIDELTPAKTGMTFLKVQMNTDLLTEDLKKKRASNESYWLIGQPDVEVRKVAQASSLHEKSKGIGRQDACATQYVVEVKGFDYYNPRTGAIESGDVGKIAIWLLDTDYDGRSLFPRQVFFPLAGDKEGWARLARNLKAEIDEGLIEAYRGTVSLPFVPGPNRRVAVKIVDDRGIESLKVVGV